MNTLHLCIITGQPLANLIPLLQEQPDKVVLLHTQDKKNEAEKFKKTLNQAGFSDENIHLKDGLPTHQFDQVSLYAMECMDDLKQRYPDNKLTWNATGGTKHMALAIWEVLNKKHDRVIYCDTRQGIIEELNPDVQSTDLESHLTPKLYLTALGKIKRHAASDSHEWRERALARKPATRHLGDNAEALRGLIQQFNRQLHRDSSTPDPLVLNRVGPDWRKALQQLENCGLLDKADERHYNPMNMEAVSYLTGAWLEEYVWHAARDQQVDHAESSLKFGDSTHHKQGQDNEIDAFIVHRNRLLLIECKSGHMGKDATKDSSMIYQLDSIGSHAGGSQATRMLVSAQPLQHKTNEGRHINTQARASATDIHTLEGGQLKNLGASIRQWKESGTWN